MTALSIKKLCTHKQIITCPDKKKAEYSFINILKNGQLNGRKTINKQWEWYEDGKVKLEANYNMQGALDGEFVCFWQNGTKQRYDIYEEGKLKKGNCYDSLGNKLPKYFPHITMASFPGGTSILMAYLNKTIKYPVEAARNKIQGRVIVRFIVEENGTLSNISILKGINQQLDQEALRVVSSMPKWIPGTNEGKNIKFKYTLPISFRLQ